MYRPLVALYAEGVGRNLNGCVFTTLHLTVALYAEGVGRNYAPALAGVTIGGSPSTRRAWVEII